MSSACEELDACQDRAMFYLACAINAVRFVFANPAETLQMIEELGPHAEIVAAIRRAKKLIGDQR